MEQIKYDKKKRSFAITPGNSLYCFAINREGARSRLPEGDA